MAAGGGGRLVPADALGQDVPPAHYHQNFLPHAIVGSGLQVSACHAPPFGFLWNSRRLEPVDMPGRTVCRIAVSGLQTTANGNDVPVCTVGSGYVSMWDAEKRIIAISSAAHVFCPNKERALDDDRIPQRIAENLFGSTFTFFDWAGDRLVESVHLEGTQACSVAYLHPDVTPPGQTGDIIVIGFPEATSCRNNRWEHECTLAEHLVHSRTRLTHPAVGFDEGPDFTPGLTCVVAAHFGSIRPNDPLDPPLAEANPPQLSSGKLLCVRLRNPDMRHVTIFHNARTFKGSSGSPLFVRDRILGQNIGISPVHTGANYYNQYYTCSSYFLDEVLDFLTHARAQLQHGRLGHLLVFRWKTGMLQQVSLPFKTKCLLEWKKRKLW